MKPWIGFDLGTSAWLRMRSTSSTTACASSAMVNHSMYSPARFEHFGEDLAHRGLLLPWDRVGIGFPNSLQ